MRELSDLQRQFAAYIMRRDETVPAAVVGDEKAAAGERMELYAGAYVTRLAEVLGEDFPGVWGMLGDDQFWQLCQDYIAAHPSVYPSIRWFGSHFTDFLRNTEPYAEYTQVAEMAAFEWAQGLVFDAAQGDVLDMQAFAEIPAEQWGGMHFEFSPAMQLLDLRWNIPELWSALNREDDAIPVLSEAEYPLVWLLWRQALNPGWRVLDVDEAWALDNAIAGSTFGDICEGLLEWVDQVNAPLRAAGFLRSWVEHGLVVALR